MFEKSWNSIVIMTLPSQFTPFLETMVLQALNEINNHQLWFVYLLKDRRTDKYEYAGTTSDPKARIAKHLKEAKSSNPKKPKDEWICDLLNSGLRPIMEYRRICTFEEAKLEEQKLIEYYKVRGQASFNQRNAIRPLKGRPRFPSIQLWHLTTEEKDKWFYANFDREVVDFTRISRLSKQIWELKRQKEAIIKEGNKAKTLSNP